jgi:hypothetical protein
LEELEEWASMLEIHGSKSALIDEVKYGSKSVAFFEHILEEMIWPGQVQGFPDEDFLFARDSQKEAAMKDAEDSLLKQIQRATAVSPILSIFFCVIWQIREEDQVIEWISDSLLNMRRCRAGQDLR